MPRIQSGSDAKIHSEIFCIKEDHAANGVVPGTAARFDVAAGIESIPFAKCFKLSRDLKDVRQPSRSLEMRMPWIIRDTIVADNKLNAVSVLYDLPGSIDVEAGQSFSGADQVVAARYSHLGYQRKLRKQSFLFC